MPAPPAARKRPAPDPYRVLARRDPVLKRLMHEHGRPDPFVHHDGGRTGDDYFAALVLDISGQQLSIAAAFAVYDRIAAATGGRPHPAGVIALGPDGLRACGLSRAKAAYVTGLAERQLSGAIDLRGLDRLSDEEAMAALRALPGIGRWTAETFLLHGLRRPDVLPADDIGIRRAVRREWALDAAPGAEEVRRRGLAWSPYRSYAAALLWRSLRLTTPPPK
ncbi:DNA-3-methyladenine glycosylase II [Streptomyces sp. DvalAA-14]|uniref:DNA-3-methyladenine glycosylase family protein n=1 Tax=unclassified Streptomyces TaxID=2593676 RepID=UPI00081AFFFD|nr:MULTISPECIES: DNA-3-methyladenine glycosylase [unclassified Streptomyces]MYS23121.1 DNA-3-methyladenine glycosylase 2 family protein [Streptomyces sp. SID4948]SCE27795.1 DNA-3-methyladenine glycosylase II [Streptomyces sp. DvalAA-14]